MSGPGEDPADAQDATAVDEAGLDPVTQDRVAAALAALPALALPDDVAARLHAALAAERDTPAPAAEHAVASAGATVTALQPRRARVPRGNAAVLGAAASVVVVLALGVAWVASGHVGGTSGSSAAAAGAVPGASPVNVFAVHPTESGVGYTPAALPAQARTLVDLSTVHPSAATVSGAATSPAGALTSASGPSGGTAGASSSGSIPASRSSAVAPTVTALLTTPSVLDRCLQELEAGGPPLRPLAVDGGTFRSAPAVVVVLSGGGQQLAVYVVTPACGQGGDPHLLYYANVTR